MVLTTSDGSAVEMERTSAYTRRIEHVRSGSGDAVVASRSGQSGATGDTFAIERGCTRPDHFHRYVAVRIVALSQFTVHISAPGPERAIVLQRKTELIPTRDRDNARETRYL